MENTDKNNNKRKKINLFFLTQYHYILGHLFCFLWFLYFPFLFFRETVFT